MSGFYAFSYPCGQPRPDEPVGGRSYPTAREAWAVLLENRIAHEDLPGSWSDVGEYSSTVSYLDYNAGTERFGGKGMCEFGSPHEDWPLAPDGTGRIFGMTPHVGRGEHDDETRDAGIVYEVVAK